MRQAFDEGLVEAAVALPKDTLRFSVVNADTTSADPLTTEATS
jgi:hypothetical protein